MKFKKKLFQMLFGLLLMVGTLPAGAQNNPVIQLNLNNATLSEALRAIESQSDYRFVYDNSVPLQQRVTTQITDRNITTVLSRIFGGKGISYEVAGNQIVLKPQAQQPVQRQNVTGTIVDAAGEPVIGATVMVKGDATKGTITDYDGNFTLPNVPQNATVAISYVGYKPTELPANSPQLANLVLQEDSELLDEVVVVGYGVQRRVNLTGAISQVKMEEVLGDRPVNNAYAALQGTIPGLTVSGSSTPGQNNKTMNIRGTLSINGGSPLILIDNVPGDLNMINPEDIESVSVLKDAASSAIYGARAANGVVLITTKRPSSNTAFQLNYNNNFGYETSINNPKQASLDMYFRAYQDAGFSNNYWSNAQDVTKWRNYLKEYKVNPSVFKTIGDGIFVDEDNIPYYLNEKDLFKNILDTGYFTNHNISASGGTENIRYRMSGGISTEDGPLITNKDYFKRLNISSFISADMTDWFTQELDIKYAHSKSTMPQARGNDFFTMRLVNYYPEGELPGSLTLNGKDALVFTPRNLILYASTSNTIRNNPRIFSKSIIKPIKNLEVIFEYTYDKDDYNYSYYDEKWQYTTIQLAVTTSPANDLYTRQRYFTDYNAINTYSNYTRSIDNHNLKLMGGYNQESSYYEYIQNQVKDQVAPIVPSLGNATGEITNMENYSEYTIRSGFFRLNYDFSNKYLFEMNGRYDGSSKFPKANRFGFFPSVSVGWQIGKEKFLSSTHKWMDELKLRASWGQIGNQAIDPYQYNPSMIIDNASNVWLVSGEKVTTIGVPHLVSKTFTWETVETTDIGLDFSLFNYRLRGTFDWYQRLTNGMLTKAGALELPATVGTEAPAQNGANMRTRGWEFGINWRDNIGKIAYNIGFNIYDNRSFITKFANETGLFYDWNDIQEDKRYRKDMELGEIWGYINDGFYTVNDFESTTTWKLKEGITSIQGFNVRPGDEKFKNLRDNENSKNQIDEGNNTAENPGDRTVIGNSTPRFQFGGNIGVSYSGFDLNIMFQGVGKRDYWLTGQAMFPFNASGPSNAIFEPLYYNQTDYWRPISQDPNNKNYMVAENPNAKYFRLYGQMENVLSNKRISDKYLQSATYLRLSTSHKLI